MFYTDDFMADVLGIVELPDVLYHYTSIDSLAHILSSRTLRLSRLDGVNDPTEASASDLESASTLVFASCWTAEVRESLAMWRMYTANMDGVRLKFPSNPFAGRHKPEVFEKGGAMQRIDASIEIKRGNGGPGIVTYYVSGPNKIYYTDDPRFTNGTCLEDIGGRWNVQLYDLGMAKNSYWEFEQEWRFRVLATFSERTLGTPKPADDPYLDLLAHPVVENAIFLPVDSSCFENVEILLGPCVSSAQEIIVQALLQSYAPGAEVKKSEIKVRSK